MRAGKSWGNPSPPEAGKCSVGVTRPDGVITDAITEVMSAPDGLKSWMTGDGGHGSCRRGPRP